MGEKVKSCIIFGGNIDELDIGILDFVDEKTYIICADRGYEAAVKLNLEPDLIIGDFDSSVKPITDAEVIELPIHKDDTDLHFAVKEAVKRGFNNIILSCVTGGRLDQTVATVFTANFLLNNNCSVKVFDYNTSIYFTTSLLKVSKPCFPCYLSVFPLNGGAEGVSISGGEYSLDNARLGLDFPIGVSNTFKDDSVTISVKSGRLMVMIIRA